MLRSSGPGQVLGSYVVNRVLALRLVQLLGWVFETKKERKKDIGSSMTTLVTFRVVRFYGLKRCAQKMQFSGAIKNVASLGTFIQNAKWWKTRTDSAATEPK